MEFIFRKAVQEDVPHIMKMMEEVSSSMPHPQWFLADDEEYIRAHLEGKGFAIAACAGEAQELAGFFVVKYPRQEENLGTYLDFTEEQLKTTAVMDIAVVSAKYRGNHLQLRMAQAAEQHIDTEKYPILLCTIHPDNRYSLSNMKSLGYEICKKVKCYGGLDRYILKKEFSNSNKFRIPQT